MVYIDNMNASFGRMKMCHMIADTTQELLEMVDKIGVNRKWIQDAGTGQEHFDICQSKKVKAIAFGAREITMIELGRMLAKRRSSPFDKVKAICDEIYHLDVQQITIDLVQDEVEELLGNNSNPSRDEVDAAAYDTSILLDAMNPKFEHDIDILKRLYKALTGWSDDI